ncbi:MAG: DUF6289 family protein [Acidobacteriota bacterium]|nr:DUF6289 family protein [Acidobacteriota bacterium]
MHMLRTLPRFRIILIFAAALALAAILSFGVGTQTADAEYCGDGFFQRFYSDATLTTQVGTRNRACNGVTYTYGQVTQWSTVNFFPCCS